jgi:hypothetical protein
MNPQPHKEPKIYEGREGIMTVDAVDAVVN